MSVSPNPPSSGPSDPARHIAHIALQCLDLTSLNDSDGPQQVEELCARARRAQAAPAAVCVWPRLAARAREELPAAVAVAAVANFPDGGTDIERALRDTGQIVQAGAQEVDVVLPWRALLAGEEAACSALLQAVRRACEGLKLKVILESGELPDAALVRRAGELALQSGADYIKTSTGKTRRGASPEAARVMLQTLADHEHAGGQRAGFKASGGVRTVADAGLYIGLVESILGPGAAAPARFRIGASGLLDDIEATLAWPATLPRGPATGPRTTY
jgi:deoxyribose-phosphate aldolase